MTASCEGLSENLPLCDLYGLSKSLVRQPSKGLNVRGSRMRFQVAFAFPVFIKHEESGIGLRLVQIVVNAAHLRTSGSQQAFQNLPNARFLAGLRTDVRNHSKTVVHTPPMATEYLVALNQLEDVAVHYEGEDAKQKDQAHLYEPFFYGDAQIATQRSFDEKHQHVAAVQNRYR